MPRKLATDPRHALNAVCPYYTMFPLEYPLGILRRRGKAARRVLDPFCGRGTTLYAARARGIESWGIDISPVAVAIARAKTARTTPDEAVVLAKEILSRKQEVAVPKGDFWELAYTRDVLSEVCRLREALSTDESERAALLRALCLGALHGPLSKNPEKAGYFSNQMPRTFASKPAYSVGYWLKSKLFPPTVSTLDVLVRRAARLKEGELSFIGHSTNVIPGNSSFLGSYPKLPGGFDTVITSPPYYGMNLYIQDQWLRNWFVGASANIEYGKTEQVSHHSVAEFTGSLADVWNNIGVVASSELHLHVRFGSIPSRNCQPLDILKNSLSLSHYAWKIISVRSARTSASGRRQADYMSIASVAAEEYDLHASLAS